MHVKTFWTAVNHGTKFFFLIYEIIFNMHHKIISEVTRTVVSITKYFKETTTNTALIRNVEKLTVAVHRKKS